MISRRDLLAYALAAGAASVTSPLSRILAAVPANPRIDVGWANTLVDFIVPQLPPTATGYTHVNTPWTFTMDTGSRAGNHALTTYTAAVRKAR